MATFLRIVPGYVRGVEPRPLLVNLDKVDIIREMPDGTTIFEFVDGERLQVSESMESLIHRLAGKGTLVDR